MFFNNKKNKREHISLRYELTHMSNLALLLRCFSSVNHEFPSTKTKEQKSFKY